MLKAILINLLAVSLSCNYNNASKEDKKDSKIFAKKIDSINALLCEGDIVFRGGTDIESDIIRNFSKSDKMFSHCGIVIKEDSVLEIAHILGGYSNPKGTIIIEPVEKFLSYPQNESAGIFATNLDSFELKRIYYFIDSVKQKNVIFDLKFNLFTKDELYCTEFIIDAITFAKNKNAYSIFKPSKYYVRNTKYSFLANSQGDFMFYPIDGFKNNSIFIKKNCYFFPNYAKH